METREADGVVILREDTYERIERNTLRRSSHVAFYTPLGDWIRGDVEMGPAYRYDWVEGANGKWTFEYQP